ncbi:MAG: choice-of-anchor D domain-containing protein [Planctomycetota bacterium]
MTKRLVLFTLAVLLGGLTATPLLALSTPAPPVGGPPAPSFAQMSGGMTVTTFVDNEAAKFGCAFREKQAGVASPTSDWRTIRVSNSAWVSASLNISAVILSGDASQFQLDTSALNFAGIQPGSSSDMRIQFVPMAVGTFNATIEVTYQTDPQNNPTQYTTFRINLSGSAVAGSTTHLVFRHETSNGPELWQGQTDIDSRAFESRVVNAGQSTGVDIWISHEGTGSVTVAPVALAAASGFVLDTSNFTSPLSTGQKTYVTVFFDPQSAVAYNEVITFTHNDPTQTSPFEVEVRGSGIDIPSRLRVTDQPGPYYAQFGGPAGMPAAYTGNHIDNNSAAIDLGDVALGAGNTVSITIAHGGMGYIDINMLYVAGPDLAVGTPVSSSGNLVVSASGFVNNLSEATYNTFTVTFAPTTLGSFSGSVTFSHDDGSDVTPYTLNIIGNGVASTGVGGSTGSTGGAGCASGDGSDTTLLVLLSLLVAVTVFRMRFRTR